MHAKLSGYPYEWKCPEISIQFLTFSMILHDENVKSLKSSPHMESFSFDNSTPVLLLVLIKTTENGQINSNTTVG